MAIPWLSSKRMRFARLLVSVVVVLEITSRHPRVLGEEDDSEALSFDLQAHNTAAVSSVVSDSIDMDLQMLHKQFEQEKQQLKFPDGSSNKSNGEGLELGLDKELLDSDASQVVAVEGKSEAVEKYVEEAEREEAAHSLVGALQSRLFAKRQKSLADDYGDKNEEGVADGSENKRDIHLDMDLQVKQWLSAKDAEDVEDAEDAEDTEDSVDLTSADPSRIFNDPDLLMRGIDERSSSSASDKMGSSQAENEFNIDAMPSITKTQSLDNMFAWYDLGDTSVNAENLAMRHDEAHSKGKEDQEGDSIEEEVDTEGWLSKTSVEKIELDSRIHSLDSSEDDDENNSDGDGVNHDVHTHGIDTAHD